MFFSSCCLSYHFPVFPFLMFLSVTRPYLLLMFPFVLCFHFLSRLISFFVLCFFLLVPPPSHLLIFCLSFSPGPRVRLKRNTNEKNNYLILFAFQGSLRKCPLRKVIVYLLFWWISFGSQNVLCLDILGICFEGVRDSLLLFLIVVLSLFWCLVKSLLSLQLVSYARIFGIRSVLCSCFFILGASASFEFC